MDQIHPNYGLTKSKQEGTIEEQFINPLPRAVIRQNSFILLDGEWRFAIDMNDIGLINGWHLGHKYEHTANWPGSIEEHMIAAKGQSPDNVWRDKVFAWYEIVHHIPCCN
jgi:hypothetical protein